MLYDTDQMDDLERIQAIHFMLGQILDHEHAQGGLGVRELVTLGIVEAILSEHFDGVSRVVEVA